LEKKIKNSFFQKKLNSMKHFLTFLVGCLLCGTPLSAQTVYQKHLGSAGADYMTDMQQLPDGKYVTLGYTAQRDSTYAQFFKLDSNMNVIWARTFSFNNQMKPTEITQTLDKGFIITGRTWQTPTAAAKQGGFVIKTDSLGVTQWQRIIKFDGTETIVKVTQEADSSLRYFVAGALTSSYMKADKLGTPANAGISPTNGAEDFIMRKVVKVGPERFAVMGRFPTSEDYIIMMNRDTIQWAREYTGIYNTGRFLDLTTDAAGNLYFTGDYKVGAYELRQIHVGKLTQNGLVRWTTVLPLIKNGGRGIDTTWRFTVGNNIRLVGRKLYVAGSILNEHKRYSNATITALDTAVPSVGGKNWLWTRTYGQGTGTIVDSFSRVFPLSNGQLLGAGRTSLGGNLNTSNFYFVKTDSGGVNSCNYGSYGPVEEVSNTAFLPILQQYIGLATPLANLTTYTDAIPNSANAPLGATSTLCTAQICAPGIVTAAITPLAICANDSVTVTASGATNYLWTSLLGLPSARTDSTFKIGLPNVGTIAFTIAAQPRSQNCFASQTINVTVRPLPSAGIATPKLICYGDSVSISSGATGTMLWSSATNTPFRQVSLGSVMVKPTTFGVQTINVKVTDPVSLCLNYNSTTVTVRDNVTPTVDFIGLGCPGPEMTLRAVGTHEGATPYFDWLVDGVLVGGRRELILANAVGKRAQVVMNVGTDVCPAPPSTRQIIAPVKIVQCRVGTGEIAALQSLLVYPNPTQGDFSVKMDLDAPKTVRFRILNLLGQTVHMVKPRLVGAGEYIESFNVSNLAAGMYLVETKLDNQAVMTKLQVQ
jgi:hypothetical protein